MTDITLQIPISKSLKEKAEKASHSQGFSLQQAVKALLERFSKKEITLEQFPAEEVELSPAAEKRFKKAKEDIEAGRGIIYTKNADEMIKTLREKVKEYNATHFKTKRYHPHESCAYRSISDTIFRSLFSKSSAPKTI